MITRVALRVRPLRVERVLRRAGRWRRSGGRGRCCARSSRTGSRRTSRGSPTRRRRGSASRWRGRARWDAGCWTAAACWSAAGRARRAAPRRRGCWRAAARGRWAPQPGRAWETSRFAGPHLRDDLLDRGVLVETLETATTWSNLGALYDAVRGALDGLHVGCHVSHLYPTGASLYFTVLGRQAADPVGAVARGQGRGDARDRRGRAARSPTTTRSAATTRPIWATRSARSAWSCCARSRSAATRPGS